MSTVQFFFLIYCITKAKNFDSLDKELSLTVFVIFFSNHYSCCTTLYARHEDNPTEIRREIAIQRIKRVIASLTRTNKCRVKYHKPVNCFILSTFYSMNSLTRHVTSAKT